MIRHLGPTPILKAAVLLAVFSISRIAAAETTLFVDPPWTRGFSANSTYQEWDIFQSYTNSLPNTTPSGPIPVDAFPGPLPSMATPAVAAPPFNPNGAASVAVGPSGIWLLSSGNIYSPTLIAEVDAFVPNYNLDISATPVGWTTLVMQVRSSGSVLNPASVRLTAFDSAEVVLAGQELLSPVESATRFSLVSVIPQGTATTEDRWFEFHVPGNAAKYKLEFAGSGSSTSIQQLAIDSIYTSAETPVNVAAPALVPEPSSLLLAIGSVLGGLLFVRRARKNQAKFGA